MSTGWAELNLSWACWPVEVLHTHTHARTHARTRQEELLLYVQTHAQSSDLLGLIRRRRRQSKAKRSQAEFQQVFAGFKSEYRANGRDWQQGVRGQKVHLLGNLKQPHGVIKGSAARSYTYECTYSTLMGTDIVYDVRTHGYLNSPWKKLPRYARAHAVCTR